MHKFSTASPQSSALTVLRSVGLLSVPYSTLAGGLGYPLAGRRALSVRRFLHFAQMKAAALRDENLCIIRA